MIVMTSLKKKGIIQEERKECPNTTSTTAAAKNQEREATLWANNENIRSTTRNKEMKSGDSSLSMSSHNDLTQQHPKTSLLHSQQQQLRHKEQSRRTRTALKELDETSSNTRSSCHDLDCPSCSCPSIKTPPSRLDVHQCHPPTPSHVKEVSRVSLWTSSHLDVLDLQVWYEVLGASKTLLPSSPYIILSVRQYFYKTLTDTLTHVFQFSDCFCVSLTSPSLIYDKLVELHCPKQRSSQFLIFCLTALVLLWVILES